jgi:hypothetical protein
MHLTALIIIIMLQLCATYINGAPNQTRPRKLTSEDTSKLTDNQWLYNKIYYRRKRPWYGRYRHHTNE